MSEKSATTSTVLHLRFKLRVPPHVLLAQSRDAATVVASVEGLVWKIWILQQEELEMGGIYLFTNREAAEAYLNHPVTQAVRNNPAVVSTKSQLWDVESSLSAIDRITTLKSVSRTRSSFPDNFRFADQSGAHADSLPRCSVNGVFAPRNSRQVPFPFLQVDLGGCGWQLHRLERFLETNSDFF
jgi:hypothetical protein